MAGHSFSPEYWKSVKFAMVDMVRQVGFPFLMMTQSEREELAVYPHWLRDQLCVAGQRLRRL